MYNLHCCNYFWYCPPPSRNNFGMLCGQSSMEFMFSLRTGILFLYVMFGGGGASQTNKTLYYLVKLYSYSQILHILQIELTRIYIRSLRFSCWINWYKWLAVQRHYSFRITHWHGNTRVIKYSRKMKKMKIELQKCRKKNSFLKIEITCACYILKLLSDKTSRKLLSE